MNLRAPSFKVQTLCLATVFAIALFFIGQNDAFAQSADFDTVQRNVAKNIIYVPKFVAMLGYVIATFFAISGLLKLKDWMEDGERNSINPVIFRFAVAALLIWFPYIIVLVNSAFFGGDANGSRSSNISINAPALNVFEKAK